MLESVKKMKFAKWSEQNYTDKIFRIIKVIQRTPLHLYELEDLNGTLIEGIFYGRNSQRFASLNVTFIK